MDPVNRKITVRGIELRTRTPRRFAAVAVRPEDVTTDEGTYVAFVEVLKRSDSFDAASAAARRYGFGFGHGCFAVVVDLTTGEEVR